MAAVIFTATSTHCLLGCKYHTSHSHCTRRLTSPLLDTQSQPRGRKSCISQFLSLRNQPLWCSGNLRREASSCQSCFRSRGVPVAAVAAATIFTWLVFYLETWACVKVTGSKDPMMNVEESIFYIVGALMHEGGNIQFVKLFLDY